MRYKVAVHRAYVEKCTVQCYFVQYDMSLLEVNTPVFLRDQSQGCFKALSKLKREFDFGVSFFYIQV